MTVDYYNIRKKDVIAGGPLYVNIAPVGGSFLFTATGSPVTASSNPVAVIIGIGDDVGTAQVTASVKN